MQSFCSVRECRKQIHAKGMCREHWTRLRRYGRLHRINIQNNGRICSIDGCDNPSRKIGLCENHYALNKRNGMPVKQDRTQKTKHPLYAIWWPRKRAGILCKEWHDFYVFISDVGKRPSKNHILVRVKEEKFGPLNFAWHEFLKRMPGEKVKDWHARKWANRRKNFPDYERFRWIKRKFGLNPEDYDRMLVAQNGTCAICLNKETSIHYQTGQAKSLSVDHCHDTGKIRGLLCFRCNSVIGRVEESLPLLKAMEKYLTKHKKKEDCQMAVLRKPPYDPDNHRYPKWVGSVIVQNKEEHDALIAAEVPAKAEPAKADEPNDKEALLSVALSMGIDADKRWGVERLKAAIAEKTPEQVVSQ